MTAANHKQASCPRCGTGFAIELGVCLQCGHDRALDSPQRYQPRQVSLIERLILTTLYLEDRQIKWWHRPGRIIFLAAVAVVSYLLWLAISPSP